MLSNLSPFFLGSFSASPDAHLEVAFVAGFGSLLSSPLLPLSFSKSIANRRALRDLSIRRLYTAPCKGKSDRHHKIPCKCGKRCRYHETCGTLQGDACGSSYGETPAGCRRNAPAGRT